MVEEEGARPWGWAVAHWAGWGFLAASVGMVASGRLEGLGFGAVHFATVSELVDALYATPGAFSLSLSVAMNR